MRKKETIRETIRQKLKIQDPDDLQRRSRKIQDLLFRQEEFRKSRHLLIYLSMPSEVETLSVVKKCLSEGKRVIVPRIMPDTGTLELRAIGSLAQCQAVGKWGILEPQVERTEEVEPYELDCAVIPGLAFDAQGGRLGRGKGYYDRLLPTIPKNVKKIGLAFSFQVLPAVPLAAHDVRVDIVLSA